MIHLLFIFIISCINGDEVVRTKSGPVKGVTLNTGNIEAFLGIPYAEPPVGRLRFAKPIPKSPWRKIFNAKKLPPACLQPGMALTSQHLNESLKMEEDCLYLNLWVPKSNTKLKAVMVYIHGGGLRSGSSSFKIYNGAALAEQGDVIVASMNYRLAMLGLFSAFIEAAPGNMALYDQLLSIQWIKSNAKRFGGDPDNIVLFGESSGAFAISVFMVSPLSKNLFKRAILQSASAISPILSDENQLLRNGSQIVSTLVGCATNNEDLMENPEKVVECMQKLPADTFINTDLIPFTTLEMLIPRVRDELIPMSPTDLYRKGEFKDTEVLLGVTADEGSIFVAFQLGIPIGDLFGKTIDVNALNETSDNEMIRSLRNEDNEEIIQSYFERVKKQSRYSYLHAVGDIIGDSLITCPTLFQADFQSLKSRPVYFYLFDYRSPTSLFAEWAGVPHFEEIQYLFGNPLIRTFSQYEEELSKEMMNMWSAFAKTGNPSISGGLTWPEYTYDDPKYISISLRDKIGFKPDNYRCEAWRNLYRSTIDDEVIQNLENASD